MQADTPTTPAAANLSPERPFDSTPRGSFALGGNQEATFWFWRIVPVLFGLAAWLPQIWSSLRNLAQFEGGAMEPVTSSAFLQNFVGGLAGQAGLSVAGAAVAGVIAYCVWALARSVGAPRWAAATMASISAVAPLFGIAPSPALSLDDGVFSALMTLAITAVVWTARHENSNCLMVAFIVAIVAAAIRPGAAWPAIAIGLAAFCASRNLEEGPWVGMLSSLCWAPGLYVAHKIISDDSAPASLTDLSQTQRLSDQLQEGARLGVNAVDAASLSLPVILNGLLSALPFLIFGVAAVAGMVILYLLGKNRRRGAIAGAIAAVIAVFGAAGYGDLTAARLLLDSVFLGLGAALGLVLPALWKRFQMSRTKNATLS